MALKLQQVDGEQQQYIERAAAVTDAQIRIAKDLAEKYFNYERDPNAVNAIIQALATNYAAEVRKAKT